MAAGQPPRFPRVHGGPLRVHRVPVGFIGGSSGAHEGERGVHQESPGSMRSPSGHGGPRGHAGVVVRVGAASFQFRLRQIGLHLVMFTCVGVRFVVVSVGVRFCFVWCSLCCC